MAEICETLRTIDPEFFDTEVKYLAAVSNLEKELGGSITPSVGEFLAAKEEKFASEIIYIGWQGFQLNMDIFHAPINAMSQITFRTRRACILPFLQALFCCCLYSFQICFRMTRVAKRSLHTRRKNLLTI